MTLNGDVFCPAEASEPPSKIAIKLSRLHNRCHEIHTVSAWDFRLAGSQCIARVSGSIIEPTAQALTNFLIESLVSRFTEHSYRLWIR